LYDIYKKIKAMNVDFFDDDAANIDAAKMLRTNPEEYNLIIRKMVASTHN
jgi:ubiquitin-protein ligase